MKLVLKFIIFLLVLKLCDIFIHFFMKNDNVKDLRNNLSSKKSHCINKCGLKIPECHSKCQVNYKFEYDEAAKCAKNCETIEDCIAKCYHNWAPNPI